jgi:2-dehydropantoate 2-reductase
MRYLIYGTGGVGGFFGGKLARGGEDVWFLARGEHLRAMRRKGLWVRSSEGSFRIRSGQFTDDPGKVPAPDVVLFCVKTYDTEEAAKRLAPILPRATVIISLQNGVENEKTIKRLVPQATVYGGVAYIFSTITAPGTITEWGGPRKIVFGPMNGVITQRAREIEDSMIRAGIEVKLTDNITTELWKKLIFIASGGGFMTASRLSLAEILNVPASRDIFYRAMKEAEAVARARGIGIPSGFVERQLKILSANPSTAKTSMYHDLVRGRPLEIEELAGAIVRFGRRHRIVTPINDTIYATLLPHHVMALAQRESKHGRSRRQR